MPVTCPRCTADIPAEDVELSTRLAKCRRCDEVFALQLPAVAPPPLLDAGVPPVPPGIKVTDDGLTRRLEFRWFTPVAFFLVFFCIAWDGFLVFWYSMAFGFGGKGPDEFQWIMVLFPIIHVAVGVGLTYFTLCLFVNRTRVDVGETLRVHHEPLFWPGGVTIPADRITALYCEEVVARGKRGVRVTYTVKAVTADNRSTNVLTGLDGLSRAKFFERKLEQWLGLPPSAVPGEAV